jgi:integrase
MASVKPRKINGKLVRDSNGLIVYRCWILRGKKPNGKPKYETCTIHAANQKDADFEGEKIERAGERKTDLTFGEWAEEWLSDQKKKNELKTVFEYERVLRKVILPELGKLKLRDIKPKHVAEFRRKLSTMVYKRHARVISDHTQHKYFYQVKRILEAAYFLELIPENPANRVKAPTFEKKRIAYYSDSEARHLLKLLAVEHLMWRAIITLALTTGARRGELMALQWGDIDEEHGVVRVSKAAYRVKGYPQGVKMPKNATSIRTIAIPEAVFTLLREWRQTQGGAEEMFVCSEKQKKKVVWMDISAPSRWFYRFVRDKQLPTITLHGLRHTAATTLLSAGLSIPEVALLLGHSSPTTTSRSYAHAATGVEERGKAAMTSLLSPKTSPNGDN